MASRKALKKEISTACSYLMEELIIYHIISDQPKTDEANKLFLKSQELASKYRQKVSTQAVKAENTSARSYFSSLRSSFTEEYSLLFEEIIILSK